MAQLSPEERKNQICGLFEHVSDISADILFEACRLSLVALNEMREADLCHARYSVRSLYTHEFLQTMSATLTQADKSIIKNWFLSEKPILLMQQLLSASQQSELINLILAEKGFFSGDRLPAIIRTSLTAIAAGQSMYSSVTGWFAPEASRPKITRNNYPPPRVHRAGGITIGGASSKNSKFIFRIHNEPSLLERIKTLMNRYLRGG
jgi:hypothetical protein